MASELGDVFVQPYPTEACSNARSQRCLHAAFRTDRIPKNLANLFFRTSTVPPCSALNLVLDVVIELAND